MFGIGTSEVVFIVVVVFLIYGPDKLPEIVRKVVNFVKSIRMVSEEVTGVIRREVKNLEIITKYPNEENHKVDPDQTFSKENNADNKDNVLTPESHEED
ncbi:MAG: twin-arginine translocase TatA/TatE family subunit [Bdellovibrionales bacterium]|nr:twin-arginine translocase TatA/TatE family subunit [Bdellovibrionales bacterium]